MRIQLVKLFFVMIFLYSNVLQYLWMEIPLASPLLCAGLYFCTILYVMQSRGSLRLRDAFPTEILLLFLFAFIIIAGGLATAYNKTVLLTECLRYIQNLLTAVCLLVICNADGNIYFPVKTIAYTAFFMAVKTIFWGHLLRYGRYTFAPGLNPNAFGIIMLMGIFCFFVLSIGKRPAFLLFSLTAIGFILYGVMLTGSRKTLLGILLFIGIWFVTQFIPALYRKSPILCITVTFASIMTVAGLLLIFWQPLSETPMVQRLMHFSDESGNIVRLSMYGTAIDLLLQHPLLGIGFNQFQFIGGFGFYSHSTYAELLSCTGIIGTIVYGAVFIIMITHMVQAYRAASRDRAARSGVMLSFGFLAVILFLAVGIILFYELFGFIMLVLIIAGNQQALMLSHPFKNRKNREDYAYQGHLA